MPKKARELSALDVKRLKHPGHGGNANIAVGGVDGLQLQITPTGARSWLLRCVIAGKRRHLGLGGYPDVLLSGARDRAREAREMIRQGVDPVEYRRSTALAMAAARHREMTFQEATERFLEGKISEFKNDKHRKQWRATLYSYAINIIGNMPVSDISVIDVQRVLTPIWTEKNETASRLRGRVEAVLAWATVNGHREGDNPARWRGNLDAVLAKPAKVQTVKHHPALQLDDAAAWFFDVRERKGNATRALEFLALTAARSGEVRGATWGEIDLKARLWTIPAVRMKAKVEHRVPLTNSVTVLLEKLERAEGGSFVFPAQRGGMLSDMALSACMKRINLARGTGYLDRHSRRPAVPHGIRSTFRDWAAERTQWPYEMAEIALAHTVGSEVERAYRRGDMLEKRRAMMREWDKFLRGDETLRK